MSTPTFTVIIPTAGRSTIFRALTSVLSQLEPEDRLMVLRDSRGDWGYSARNEAVEQATTTHLAFIDDHDVFTSDALEKMRTFATNHPGRIGIFRMRYDSWQVGAYGRTLWTTPELKYMNVGTPMFCVPNVKEKLGRFDPTRYSGDYSFIAETAELMGDPIFVDEVIARIRPDRRPRFVIALDKALKLTPRVNSARARLKPRARLKVAPGKTRHREPGADGRDRSDGVLTTAVARSPKRSLDMTTATFTVIILTRGERSHELRRTLESVISQWEDGDRLILLKSNDGDRGDAARNEGVGHARTTHLIFIDDDDVYADGALDAVRVFARENPHKIGIFRMRHEFWQGGEYGRVIWKEPVLRKKNVGTPMFVVPNVPGRLGRWDSSQYAGDFKFIEETVKLIGEPVFVDQVIARVRPDRRPRVVIAVDRALKLTPRATSARALLEGALRKLRKSSQAPEYEEIEPGSGR